jgi:L-ectoine synthase
MIVKTAAELKGTVDDVRTDKWTSLRFLHEKDGMGVTLTDTTVKGGTEQILWYRNHLEACYAIEGEGSVEDLATGKVHPINPGTLYALDKHDRHCFRAKTDIRLICVFTPPLKGGETHDKDGSYAR